jgi:hypothetical protein
MFRGDFALEDIDTSNLFIDDVRKMDYMFMGCENLKKVVLQGYARSLVDMRGMFYGCKQLSDLSLLFEAKVKDITDMFFCCANLKEIDLRYLTAICASKAFSDYSVNVIYLSNIRTRRSFHYAGSKFANYVMLPQNADIEKELKNQLRVALKRYAVSMQTLSLLLCWDNNTIRNLMREGARTTLEQRTRLWDVINSPRAYMQWLTIYKDRITEQQYTKSMHAVLNILKEMTDTVEKAKG